MLEGRLRRALGRLNPSLPPDALEDAYRKISRAEAPTLVERNRILHRMLAKRGAKRLGRAEAIAVTALSERGYKMRRNGRYFTPSIPRSIEAAIASYPASFGCR